MRDGANMSATACPSRRNSGLATMWGGPTPLAANARETINSIVSAVPIGDVLLLTINGVAERLASTEAACLAAWRMCRRSAAPVDVPGVSTQRNAALHPARPCSNEVVKLSRPEARLVLVNSASRGSQKGIRPALSVATWRALTSIPATTCPCSAKNPAVARPTCPQPMTARRCGAAFTAPPPHIPQHGVRGRAPSRPPRPPLGAPAEGNGGGPPGRCSGSSTCIRHREKAGGAARAMVHVAGSSGHRGLQPACPPRPRGALAHYCSRSGQELLQSGPQARRG